MERIIDKAISIYGIRLSALGGYSDRIWKRFYWLLTMQAAIFSLLLSAISQSPANITIGKGIF